MAVTFRNSSLVSVLSEAAGFKTGLALSKSDIIEMFPEDSDFHQTLSVPDDTFIRIYPEDVDEMFTTLLYRLGNIDSPGCIPSTVRILHKYKEDKKLSVINEQIMQLWILHLSLAMKNAVEKGEKQLDPTPFMKECAAKFGRTGIDISMEYILGNSDDMHRRLGRIRRVDWKDQIALRELFESESLGSLYGNFIDQRFVDYLHKNMGKLHDMHWRKFEGLTAEYFVREGYDVELGPGRNDGGIDVRVWKKERVEGEPPLMLIQCKRYKSKIDRVVVKALWADVCHEQAESGLIVTTSGISPGGKTDCEARGYNITEANKTVIGQWLEKMKTPGAGIFMGQ